MLRRMKTLPLPERPLNAGRLGMMVQGKGITEKRGAGFCFRAVHQRGMATTERDIRCESEANLGRLPNFGLFDLPEAGIPPF
jgi:hypothetical protein